MHASALWAVIYWVRGPHVLGTVIAITSLLLLASFASHRRWGLTVASHLVIGLAYTSISGIVLITGGMDSTTGVWFFIPPVAASLLMGWRGSLAWSALSVATAMAIWAVDIYTRFASLLPDATSPRLKALSFVSVLLVMTIIAWIYATNQQRSLTRIRRSRARLAEAQSALEAAYRELRESQKRLLV